MSKVRNGVVLYRRLPPDCTVFDEQCTSSPQLHTPPWAVLRPPEATTSTREHRRSLLRPMHGRSDATAVTPAPSCIRTVTLRCTSAAVPSLLQRQELPRRCRRSPCTAKNRPTARQHLLQLRTSKRHSMHAATRPPFIHSHCPATFCSTSGNMALPSHLKKNKLTRATPKRNVHACSRKKKKKRKACGRTCMR